MTSKRTLATIMFIDMVGYIIAKHLEPQEDALLSIEEVLIRFFRQKRALLILDIFEESLAYWRQQKDQKKVGLALNNLGWSYINHDQYLKSDAASLEARSIIEATKWSLSP